MLQLDSDMPTKVQRIAEAAGLIYADVQCGTAKWHRTASFTSWTASESDAVAAGQQQRRYLIASITKPIVAMGLLKLAAEGEVTLSHRLGHLLPEFSKATFRRITLRHLLTHTSGFPDMLPNNTELRAAQAPLPEFVQQAASVDLEFSTASDCRYSSVGFLLIAAVVEKISGQTMSQFLNEQFFQPLAMHDSWLGIPEAQADQLLPTILPCQLPDWQPQADSWGWNSRYWRTLGAPWGGMLASAADLSRFAVMMLSEGVGPQGKHLLPPAVVRSALTDQSSELTSQAGGVRAWGFGWRKQWPSHAASFGDFLSPDTAGHWGATGTTMWMDPASGRYVVVLTTTPYEISQTAIQQLSNIATVESP